MSHHIPGLLMNITRSGHAYQSLCSMTDNDFAIWFEHLLRRKQAFMEFYEKNYKIPARFVCPECHERISDDRFKMEYVKLRLLDR